MTTESPRTRIRVPIKALAVTAFLALVAALVHLPAASADEQADAAWPYARFDAANTAHQPAPGAIADPIVIDRAYLGGTLGDLMPTDLDGDGGVDFLAIDAGRITAYDDSFGMRWQSSLIRPAGIVGIADLNGDGAREVVAHAQRELLVLSGNSGELLWSRSFNYNLTRWGTRVVDLVPQQDGAQVFVWGFNPHGILFGFDAGFDAVEELWRTTPDNEFAEAYVPSVMIGDMNGDGSDELVIATCGSVITYDGPTGQEISGDDGWQGRVDWTTGPGIDCRNYGNIYLQDLNDDGYPEVVVVADGVTLHLAVLANSPGGLSLAYDEFIEFPETTKALRSTVNSVDDLTGDGAIEVAANLYNRDGGERWETIVFGALAGTSDPVDVLVDTYLWGVQDVTGDGVPELLTSSSPTRVPSAYSSIAVQTFDQVSGGFVELWSADDARWRAQGVAIVDQSISAGGRYADNEVVTSADLSDGGLAVYVEFSDGSTAAYDFAAGAADNVWQRDSGNVLWQGAADGVSRIAVQQPDGFVSYENVAGVVVAQITTGSLAGAPTVGPLGGDRNAIVVPGSGSVQVLDYTHAGLVNRWNIPGHGSYVYRGFREAVPIVDLENDGAYGLVIADSVAGGSRLRYLDGAGDPIWDSVMPDLPEVSPGNGLYSWVAGDLRGTGTQDLYVAAFAGGYNTEVSRIVAGTDGTILSSRNDNPLNPGVGLGPWVGNPGAADVDGDGTDEAYFLAKDITYRVANGDLSSIEQVSGHSGLYHNPAFVDLTGDGSLEMLMTGGHIGFDAIEFDEADPSGRTLWHEPTDPSDMLGRIAASADITGDGAVEVATLHSDGFVRLWSGQDGVLLDEYDAGRPGSSVVTADVTGDGRANLLYGTDDGRLEALGFEAGSGLVQRWSIELDFEIGELAVADVTGDGLVEVVLTVADGFLYVVGDASVPGPVECTAVVTGDHAGPLTVSDGTTCLEEATVSGPVTVQPGAGLVSIASRVTGLIRANGASLVTLCETVVTGPVSLTGSSAVTMGDPAAGCVPNTVTGPVSVTGTSGPSVIAGNRTIGPLSCSSNDPPPVNRGFANSVVGPMTGQCADL